MPTKSLPSQPPVHGQPRGLCAACTARTNYFFLIRDIFSELIDDDLKIKTKLMVEALGFHDNSKDSVFQIMKIRKGKKLLARAMPYLPQVIEIKFVTIYYSNSNSDSLGWN